MGTEFLDGYAHIPVAQQKKVREFLKKFRDDPTSSAINYESLKGHRNPHVRTVRIDQKYRAVNSSGPGGPRGLLPWGHPARNCVSPELCEPLVDRPKGARRSSMSCGSVGSAVRGFRLVNRRSAYGLRPTARELRPKQPGVGRTQDKRPQGSQEAPSCMTRIQRWPGIAMCLTIIRPFPG